MKPYHDLLKHILEHGEKKEDRTGTGTISVFGYQNRYDLTEGFPLVTTKKIHWKSVVHELLWFIQGSTNIQYLKENGVSIWNEWADENGELGPVYGKQWRKWSGLGQSLGHTHPHFANYFSLTQLDQLQEAINTIRKNPDSRRIIVSAWNPPDVPKMKLPPCHALFQFYVSKGKLSCQLYQRSADAFLGVPFNIASYALLTHMVAHVCGLGVGDFVHSFGDLHIYSNHMEQVATQLSRDPKPLPHVRLDASIKEIDDFRFEHIQLEGYEPWPAIKAPVAV